MVRFIFVQDYLYVVDEYWLYVFGLFVIFEFEKINVVDIGWGIEIIFFYGDKLFIGVVNGMYIFDNSVFIVLEQLLVFCYVIVCDFVFVDGNIVYVMFWNGMECEIFINQFDVVDVINLIDLVLINSFSMYNLYGLFKFYNVLYICENE